MTKGRFEQLIDQLLQANSFYWKAFEFHVGSDQVSNRSCQTIKRIITIMKDRTVFGRPSLINWVFILALALIWTTLCLNSSLFLTIESFILVNLSLALCQNKSIRWSNVPIWDFNCGIAMVTSVTISLLVPTFDLTEVNSFRILSISTRFDSATYSIRFRRDSTFVSIP